MWELISEQPTNKKAITPQQDDGSFFGDFWVFGLGLSVRTYFSVFVSQSIAFVFFIPLNVPVS
jgi:hypothetical protein